MRRLLLACALALAGASTASANEYPSRPIRFLQGFAPGGNADVVTRVLGEEMAKGLGQPVVSESRAGAGGNLASEQAAKAAPDGHTIVLLTTAHVISAALYKSLAFDPVNDFAFISTVSDFPFLFVTNAKSRFTTIADYVAAARSAPSAVTFATAGVGTGQHMAGEVFASSIGAKMLHVPHRGDSAAVTALLTGDVDLMIAPATAILSLIEAGTFRPLAVSANRRWPRLPEVPTVAETVAPGYEVMAWMGVATARGVPRPIVDRLNQEIRRAIATPGVDKRLRDLGAFPIASTPEEATERTKAEIARWNKVIDAAGIARQ
ncbi:MAG: tripartite tricarboxylate transporter substrate binding protein [Hyphomicrobiales bacterium]|nr:tripartite tricarboxylate transporter substrate binding protein [Hyphomicrobiales bacterium]